jgi:hypothetical protein
MAGPLVPKVIPVMDPASSVVVIPGAVRARRLAGAQAQAATGSAAGGHGGGTGGGTGSSGGAGTGASDAPPSSDVAVVAPDTASVKPTA